MTGNGYIVIVKNHDVVLGHQLRFIAGTSKYFSAARYGGPCGSLEAAEKMRKELRKNQTEEKRDDDRRNDG